MTSSAVACRPTPSAGAPPASAAPPSGRWGLRRRLPARTAAGAAVAAFVLLVVTARVASRMQSFPVAPLRVLGLLLACLALALAAWAPRRALGLAAAGLVVSGVTAVLPVGTYLAAVAALVLVARTDRRAGAVGLGVVAAVFGLGRLLPETNSWDNLEIPLPDPVFVVFLPASVLVVALGLVARRRLPGPAAPIGTFLGRTAFVTTPEVLVVASVVAITALRYTSLFSGPWVQGSTDGWTLLPTAASAFVVGLLCAVLAATAVSPWFPRSGFAVAVLAHSTLVVLSLATSIISLPTLTACTVAALYVLGRRTLLAQGTGAAPWRGPSLAGLTVVTTAVSALAVGDEAAAMFRDMYLQAQLFTDDGYVLRRWDAFRNVFGEGLPVAVVLPALAVAGAWLVTRWLADRDRLERAVSREAATAERTRIARELHDVVAHHVSLVTVRAESAPYVVPDLPAAARDAFGEIATTSRHALDELRDVLGVLGRPDGEEVERAPQPTLADVAGLVAEAREAGARVAFDRGALDRLPEGVDVPAATGIAAHAVVREALSNARRHAPGQEVAVGLTTDDGTLRVAVSTPLTAGSAAAADARPGLGLVGLRERVDAVGGTFTAGPADGRYVVLALLPLRRRGEASA